MRMDFRDIPNELRKELSDVVVTLDTELIGQVIAKISLYDASLGDAMFDAARRSAYSEILRAMSSFEFSLHR
jgi:hypothetical protein